ncbi:MAG TPA: efflux transporter periplasmic adaptor subunit, partial [Nitrosomonas sp.]|nr:efflux transporter periplasmic adaptor subunit [Nitrosomonas sp.]
PELFQLRGEMTFSDGTVYPEEGVLDFADIRLRPETGTLQGRFRFSNPDGKGEPSVRNFLSGQFVKVRVKGYIRHNAILVPQRAVHQGPKGSFVFIINEEDKVELRSVLASSWRGKEWLIESGLSAGERVVVEGFFRILPGVKVNAVAYSLIENESASRHD